MFRTRQRGGRHVSGVLSGRHVSVVLSSDSIRSSVSMLRVNDGVFKHFGYLRRRCIVCIECRFPFSRKVAIRTPQPLITVSAHFGLYTQRCTRLICMSSYLIECKCICSVVPGSTRPFLCFCGRFLGSLTSQI